MIADLDLNALENFKTTLQKYKDTLELSDVELADIFGVSIPSIELWLTGKNLPHLIIANGLVAYMNGQINGPAKHSRCAPEGNGDTIPNKYMI